MTHVARELINLTYLKYTVDNGLRLDNRGCQYFKIVVKFLKHYSNSMLLHILFLSDSAQRETGIVEDMRLRLWFLPEQLPCSSNLPFNGNPMH